jgi:hypothetical protein
MELLSKENTSVAKQTERTKPTLVTIGKRQVISSGRFNVDLMADWVSENAQKEFVKVGELAGVLGANTIPNKKRVRKGLSPLFLALLKRGLWLAIEYQGKRSDIAPANAATAVKIADMGSEQDRQLVKAKLKRMQRSRELSAEQYDGAMKVLRTMEGEQTQDSDSELAKKLNEFATSQ